MNPFHRIAASSCLGLMFGMGCIGSPDVDRVDVSDENELNEPLTFKGTLDSQLGTVVPSGSTTGYTNDFTPTCDPSSTAPDASYIWTAPASGTYTFSTGGSAFDTVLHLRQYNNSGQTLPGACNDDANGTLQSSVTIPLSSGQVVIIVVDGYGNKSTSNQGTYFLTITPPPCVIAGVTYANGTINPSNTCQWCNASSSSTSWSNRDGYVIPGTGLCKLSTHSCIGCWDRSCGMNSVCDYVCSGGSATCPDGPEGDP